MFGGDGIHGVIDADGGNQQQAEHGEQADGNARPAQYRYRGHGGGQRHRQYLNPAFHTEYAPQQQPGQKIRGQLQPSGLIAGMAEQFVQMAAFVCPVHPRQILNACLNRRRILQTV